MARKPAQPDEKLRAEAKAYAQKAVEKANALRVKAGTRPLPPREEIAVFQAALNQYLREHAAPG
jgi:hypothetical protein